MMDDDRFDVFSRSVGEETTRRGMLKAAAGGVLGLLGLGALGESGLAKKFEGEKCKKSKQCGTGLKCKGAKKKNNGKKKKGKCRYKDGNCGKKGDACKNNGDCCGSRKCRDNKCRSKN